MAAMRVRWTPWILLGPFLAVFAVFTAYPLVQSLVLSTRRTFGPGVGRSVGMDNFVQLAHDPQFWLALKNTCVYTAGSLFIQLPLALALALLLEMPGLRGRGWYRVLLFSPSLVGVVFAAMIFGLLFEKRTGLVNALLHSLTAGLSPGFQFDLDFPWLSEHVMWAMILASLWMYVGFNMVYFSAALQNVQKQLVEAATVDGAGPLRRFVHVTVPAIRPVAGFVVLLSVIGSFQIFELPYLILDVAGRPDDRGLTLVMYLYRNGFDIGDLGYASAIGWAVGIVLIGCAALERWLSRGEAEGSP